MDHILYTNFYFSFAVKCPKFLLRFLIKAYQARSKVMHYLHTKRKEAVSRKIQVFFKIIYFLFFFQENVFNNYLFFFKFQRK